MTKKTAVAPSEDDKKPTGGWQYFGSEKTLQALARRDELQAETVAAAMRALEERATPGRANPEMRRLKRQIRQLKRLTGRQKSGRRRRPRSRSGRQRQG